MSELNSLVEDPDRFADHADPAIRRIAVAALSDRQLLASRLTGDPDAGVRAAAAIALARLGNQVLPDLLAAAGAESDETVVEALAFAVGELERAEAVPWLTDVATGDGDTLTRETATASLGAIGHPDAVPVLLDLVRTGPPQVRRRAVVALSVFEGPEVEAAIRAAAEDRNPMVREAAEMIIGR